MSRTGALEHPAAERGAAREPAERDRLAGLLGGRAATGVVLAASTLFYATFVWRPRLTIGGKTYFVLVDDAMVSMRYARNLAAGHGFAWNATGPRVEGYTNPLWTLIMAALHLLPLPDRLMALPVSLLGAVILLATGLVVRRIVLTLRPDATALANVALALTTFSYPLVYWTLRGMEVGLLALLLTTGVLMVVRGAYRTSPASLGLLAAVCALAVLTRTDALLPLACIVVAAVWLAPEDRRRVALTLAGTVVAVLAAHTGFRLAYYGNALPNTYYLKTTGVALTTRLLRGSDAAWSTTSSALYLAAALGVWATIALRRSRPVVWLIAAVVAGQVAYSVVVGGDIGEGQFLANRYVAVALPCLAALAAIGIGELVERRSVVLTLGLAGTALVVAATNPFVRTSVINAATVSRQVLAERAAVALVTVVAVVLVVLAVRGSAAGSALAVVLVGLAVVVSMNGLLLRRWALSSGGGERPFDVAHTRYALLIARHTQPAAAVAVSAAGDVPYFDERPSIDLLGKSDTRVARSRSKLRPWRPGHDRWDYTYSIGRLRPDVVAWLWQETPNDDRDMAAWGYDRLDHILFVRRGSRLVDEAGLARSLRVVPRSPSATRPPRPSTEP